MKLAEHWAIFIILLIIVGRVLFGWRKRYSAALSLRADLQAKADAYAASQANATATGGSVVIDNRTVRDGDYAEDIALSVYKETADRSLRLEREPSHRQIPRHFGGDAGYIPAVHANDIPRALESADIPGSSLSAQKSNGVRVSESRPPGDNGEVRSRQDVPDDLGGFEVYENDRSQRSGLLDSEHDRQDGITT